MSKEAIGEVKSDPTKEDLKDVQTVFQSSEESIKHNVESNPRNSDRQVTISEDVISRMEETSFMDKSKDYHPNNEKNKAPINHSHSSSTDDIISIHDITDDENIVKEDSSRPKCLQCISEVFECTIWFFKSITSSIRSRLQNCCSCNRKTVDIKNREFDDDGEYWNGNVMNGDGEEGVISFSFDKKEDSIETNETFKQTDLNEVKDHSKVNKGFEDIDIKTNHTVEHKPVKETRCSNGNEIGHRNSTTSAVCHVNIHHESHENKDVSNVASGGVSSSINNVSHDDGHRVSQCGGNQGGHSGNHDGGNSGGHTGSHDGGHGGSHDGGHGGSHDGGHGGSHDGGNGGNDCGDTGGGSDD